MALGILTVVSPDLRPSLLSSRVWGQMLSSKSLSLCGIENPDQHLIKVEEAKTVVSQVGQDSSHLLDSNTTIQQPPYQTLCLQIPHLLAL